MTWLLLLLRTMSSQTRWNRDGHKVLAKSTAPNTIYQAPVSCLVATLKEA